LIISSIRLSERVKPRISRDLESTFLPLDGETGSDRPAEGILRTGILRMGRWNYRGGWGCKMSLRIPFSLALWLGRNR
jgi:hypothetical protein